MRLFNYCFILSSFICFSQNDFEIHLIDININNNKIDVLGSKIISSKIGYNNQPSFINNNQLLFSTERNGQNDIVQYDINNGTDEFKFITSTDGSDYSPLYYKKNKITAVNLKDDGSQYLYIYDLKKNSFTIPFMDKIVGYYNYSRNMKNTIVSSILENNELVLYSTDLKTKEHIFIDNNTGRSIHRIPNNKFGMDKLSYISKKDSIWKIKSVNLANYKTKIITNTLENNEDICWLKDGSIITSKADKLYKFNPKTDKSWVELCSLAEYGIINISRIAINPNNDKLALVNSK